MTAAAGSTACATAVGRSVTLFGHWICPYSVRVEFALANRGITYALTPVPPTAARPRDFVVPQEFLDHSPKREIPLLKVDGDYLADSIPVLEWMEELFDERPLLPAGEPARALVRERVTWLDVNVYRPMVGVYYGTEPDRIATAAGRLGEALAGVGRWLEGEDWLAGDAPTLAEAIMVAVYVRLDGLARLGFAGSLPPAVAAHMDRCRALPGWSTVAWTSDQTDEFVKRFLKYRERANAATG